MCCELNNSLISRSQVIISVMTHTFLLEPSSWIIKGTWLEKTKPNAIVFNGATIINWDQSSWFTIKTKIVFPQCDREEINFEYKGCLPNHKTKYAYVLKRSDINSIEGEGWVTNDSIIQRYWVLNSERRLNGFENFFCLDDNTYHMTSGMMTGNHLLSTFEGILERRG